MSEQPARRRGRRDNGLDAAAFVPLADVDPRIGEHLLDVLWAAGVPAYLEPSTDIGPTRALTVPSPPTDRLWVDRTRRADARTIVEAETPRIPREGRPDAPGAETAGFDAGFDAAEDRVWRDLVEQFGRDHSDVVPPWPAAEDLTPATRPRPAPPRAPDPVEDTAAEVEPAPVEEPVEEEHFEPPAPPPLPRPSRYAVLALLVLAFGTLLLVAPGVLELGGDGAFALGVVSIVAGVGLLIWRLKEERGDDDDGAIV